MKKRLDVHISRLLAWIWENFPAGQMEVKYMSGDSNKGGDTLSRCGIDQPNVVIGQRDLAVCQKLEQVASLELKEGAQTTKCQIVVEVD